MSIISSLFGLPRKIDLSGVTDWHSHILPGVDDGVETIGDSIKILEEYERIGIRKV